MSWDPCPVAKDVVISARWVIPASELAERFSRSSGPGGQGVNTADSRVELIFDVVASRSIPDDLRPRVLARLGDRLSEGRVVVVATEHCNQLANRRAARLRLVELLQQAAAQPPARRRPTKPSRGAIERRIGSKKRRAELKQARRRPTE